MTAKDKMIGIAAILIGLGFIILGVTVGIKSAAKQDPGIYTEQNNTNTNNNEQINVYDEESSNGSTRYIY